MQKLLQAALGIAFVLLLALRCQADNLPPNQLNSSFDHKFYVSKCLIEFNSEAKALQISLHLFVDDLEEALQLKGIEQQRISSDKEHPEAELHIFQYLQQHLQIQIDGTNVQFDFIGKEPSADLQAIWCYLEVSEIESINRLSVSNNVLMEVFEDQKNIIHISVDKKAKGFFLFTKDNFSQQLSIE